MRFQKSPPPPPFGGRDRIMVFIFFGALAVFFAVYVTSKPGFWAAWKKNSNVAGNNDPKVLRDDENLFATQTKDGTSVPEKPPAPVTIESNTELEIPKSALRPVRDNTMGVRTAELPSYFATLKYARDNASKLRAAKAREVPYTMLMAEPWVHRGGKPISVTGRLRGLKRRTVVPNDAGIDQVFDAWVFTRDSGSNPIHVVCLSVPREMLVPELGESVVFKENPPEVSLNGYFFKTHGYQSNGDGTSASLHTAPLVLASAMANVPVAQAETRDLASEMVPWLWWFAIGVAVVLAMVLWNFAVSDWSFRHTRAHGLLQGEGVPDFHGIDALSTNEMLRELSREGLSTRGGPSEFVVYDPTTT